MRSPDGSVKQFGAGEQEEKAIEVEPSCAPGYHYWTTICEKMIHKLRDLTLRGYVILQACIRQFLFEKLFNAIMSSTVIMICLKEGHESFQSPFKIIAISK